MKEYTYKIRTGEELLLEIDKWKSLAGELVKTLKKLSGEKCPTGFHDGKEVCACFCDVAKEGIAKAREEGL